MGIEPQSSPASSGGWRRKFCVCIGHFGGFSARRLRSCSVEGSAICSFRFDFSSDIAAYGAGASADYCASVGFDSDLSHCYRPLR